MPVRDLIAKGVLILFGLSILALIVWALVQSVIAVGWFPIIVFVGFIGIGRAIWWALDVVEGQR